MTLFNSLSQTYKTSIINIPIFTAEEICLWEYKHSSKDRELTDDRTSINLELLENSRITCNALLIWENVVQFLS